MTTVIREVIPTIEEALGKPIFDFGNPFTDDILEPANTLLSGAINRTSTSNGRTATVAAGEDIRPALESLRSAGGGTLILLAGTHRPTYDIVGDSKISIVGEGRDQTIIDFGSGAYGLKFIGTSGDYILNFKISDLTIQDANGTAGINIQYAKFFVIENVRTTSCSADGISIIAALYFKISNVYSDLNGSDGIYITGASSNPTRYFNLTNIVTESNTANGFYIFSDSSTSSVQYWSALACNAISEGNHGFFIDGNSGVNASLITCVAQDATEVGFYLGASQILACGCIANSCAADGFFVESGQSAVRIIGCNSTNSTDFEYNIDSGNVIAIGNSSESTKLGTLTFDLPVSLGISSGFNLYNTPVSDVNTIYMKNTSGGSLLFGNVVILKSVATADEITTTTTVGDDSVIGVVASSVTNNNITSVRTAGEFIGLKVNGTTDIAIGDFLCTYSTAGIAAKATTGDMAFAIALEAYTTDDSNGVIDALLIKPRKL